MIARLFAVLFFFCGTQPAFVQEDSLDFILASEKHDTVKGRELLQLAQRLVVNQKFRDADKAGLYALRKLEQAGNYRHHAELYFTFADIAVAQNKPGEACDYFRKSLSAAREQKDRQTEAVALGRLGMAMEQNELQDSAAYYLLLAAQAWENLGDHKQEMQAYFKAASVYVRSDPEKAIGFLERLKKEEPSAANDPEVSLLLGEARAAKKEWSKAKAHFQQAWEQAKPLKNAELQVRIAAGWVNYYEVNYSEKNYASWKHVKDSLLRITQEKVIKAETTAKKSKEEKDAAEKLLRMKESELRRQEKLHGVWMTMGAIFGVAVLIIGIIVYRKNR